MPFSNECREKQNERKRERGSEIERDGEGPSGGVGEENTNGWQSAFKHVVQVIIHS